MKSIRKRKDEKIIREAFQKCLFPNFFICSFFFPVEKMLRSSRFNFAVVIKQRGAVISDTSKILSHVAVGDSTWSRLAYLNKRDKTPNRHLRLLIVPGGCRGFSYKFVLQDPDAQQASSFNNKKDAGCTSSSSAATSSSSPTIEGASKKLEEALKVAQNLAAKFAKEDAEASAASAKAEEQATQLMSYEDDIEFINDACVLENQDSSTGASPATTCEKVVIDEVSLGKLRSAKIEFLSNLRGMAFYVDGNENVDKSCACKLSFSMKGEE